MRCVCYLEGHVGDVHQLVVCEGEQVEEAELRESSGLNLLHPVTVDQELLQRGQAVKRLLDSQGTHQGTHQETHQETQQASLWCQENVLDEGDRHLT